MSVHKIRLAGPWEWSSADSSAEHMDRSTGTPPPAQTCQLPFRCDKNQGATLISLVRRFHCPTGLSDNTTLLIALETSGGVVEVRLNGQALSTDLPSEHKAGSETLEVATQLLRFKISGSLKPFNELEVLLQPTQPHESAGLSSAALEIHE